MAPYTWPCLNIPTLTISFERSTMFVGPAIVHAFDFRVENWSYIHRPITVKFVKLPTYIAVSSSFCRLCSFTQNNRLYCMSLFKLVRLYTLTFSILIISCSCYLVRSRISWFKIYAFWTANMRRLQVPGCVVCEFSLCKVRFTQLGPKAPTIMRGGVVL